MEVVTAKIADLKPAKYNPRVPIEKDKRQKEALKNSLTKYGVVIPIIVNKRNNVVVGGHQRLAVLKEMGETEAPVKYVDLDETKERQLNIALNKIEGEWDEGKLESLLDDLSDEERRFVGFYTETKKGVFEPKQDFELYLSFAEKDKAEEWLKEHGRKEKFGRDNTVTIDLRRKDEDEDGKRK